LLKILGLKFFLKTYGNYKQFKLLLLISQISVITIVLFFQNLFLPADKHSTSVNAVTF